MGTLTWCFILATLAAGEITLLGQPSGDLELARNAQAVLTRYCSPCHGRGSPAFKGVIVDDYRQLVGPDKAVVPGSADSRLLKMVRTGAMPQGSAKLSDEEIRLLTDWVMRGAPSWETEAKASRPAALTETQVIRLIESDLVRAPERDQRFLRYFSLAHLDNAGVTEAELDRQREALVKLLNSLSWRRAISKPRTLDATGTVLRIDLRDFDWDEAIWNRIVGAYPYAITRPDQRLILDLTGSPVAYVRVDWFVATASVPPLYHEILGLPASVTDLERLLDLDTARNLRQEKFVVRAGVRNSGVSRNNRALERHETRQGAYWRSYDFTSSTGPQNIFENPLDLHPAGGEIIFNLPNGMQAYFLANGRGNRLDRAPTEIVFDRNEPDRSEIVNGRSCMSCHFAGMKTFRDDVRNVISGQASLPDRDRALAIYVEQGQLDRLLDEDAARFRHAVTEAGGRIPEDPRSEPVGAVGRRFEAPLGTELAAAELGVQPAALRAGIEGNTRLSSLGFGQLLIENGTIKRDLWQEHFPDLVRALALVEPPASFRALRAEAQSDRSAPPPRASQPELPRASRALAITTRTVWFKTGDLEGELVANADFHESGIRLVQRAALADLLVTVDRPALTFDWTYTISERKTSVVFAAGKTTAPDGRSAARQLAREIGLRLRNAVPGQP